MDASAAPIGNSTNRTKQMKMIGAFIGILVFLYIVYKIGYNSGGNAAVKEVSEGPDPSVIEPPSNVSTSSSNTMTSPSTGDIVVISTTGSKREGYVIPANLLCEQGTATGEWCNAYIQGSGPNMYVYGKNQVIGEDGSCGDGLGQKCKYFEKVEGGKIIGYFNSDQESLFTKIIEDVYAGNFPDTAADLGQTLSYDFEKGELKSKETGQVLVPNKDIPIPMVVFAISVFYRDAGKPRPTIKMNSFDTIDREQTKVLFTKFRSLTSSRTDSSANMAPVEGEGDEEDDDTMAPSPQVEEEGEDEVEEEVEDEVEDEIEEEVEDEE